MHILIKHMLQVFCGHALNMERADTTVTLYQREHGLLIALRIWPTRTATITALIATLAADVGLIRFDHSKQFLFE